MVQDSVKRLTDVANKLLDGLKMPDSSNNSELVPLYKSRGDRRSCGNYRSVKLLEHEKKVIEKIFDKQFRKMALLDEVQTRFVPGKPTVDSIFFGVIEIRIFR